VCAFFAVLIILEYSEPRQAMASIEKIEPLLINSLETAPLNTKDIHIVKEGENLSVIFENYSVPLNVTYKIFRADQSNAIKKIKPGDKIEFLTAQNVLREIKVIKNPFTQFVIEVMPEISIQKIERASEKIISFKSGVIASSFYIAGLNEVIPESIIMDLAYIFGWDIDFIFDIRKGDRFRLLYETSYIDGVAVDNGSILFAEFYNQEKRFTATRFDQQNNKWRYFDQHGESLEKAFLRAPLNFAYISSHFDLNRRHPILNKIRAHNGVDYAAKRNSPIRATGDGVVESIGWKGGYGRTIVLRHGGEISTLYAHMEKYHSTLSKGMKVAQGQTIGYVGDSGLATGPHLHYEFRIGENRADPLKVSLPSARPLAKNLLGEFDLTKNNYLNLANQLLANSPNAKFFQ